MSKKVKFLDIMNFSFTEVILSLLIISAILMTCLNSNDILHFSKRLMFIKEIYFLKEAILSFKSKYHYYPGDYPFAYNIFNNISSGNGDGYIRDYDESLIGWSHLDKSGFINLSFKFSTAQNHAKILYNMKKSRVFECGYQMLADRKLNNLNFYFSKKKNFLRFANDKAFGNLSKPCFIPMDSYAIDTKIDDGSPVSGEIFSDTGYKRDKVTDCVCKIENMKYSYCLNNKNIICIMQMSIS